MTNSNNNSKCSFNHLGTPRKYFLACLCTFVKFFAFGLNLIPKYLLDLFVNLKISQSSVRSHFAINKAQRRQTNLLLNSKANTEESVQTVARLLFTVPARGFQLRKRLTLHLGAFFFLSAMIIYICKLLKMLGFYIVRLRTNKAGGISENQNY